MRGRERRLARYCRKLEFAEGHELTLLRRVHRGYTVEGTPFDACRAARLVGAHAHGSGLSWHEALYELAMMAAMPHKGREAIWK